LSRAAGSAAGRSQQHSEGQSVFCGSALYQGFKIWTQISCRPGYNRPSIWAGTFFLLIINLLRALEILFIRDSETHFMWLPACRVHRNWYMSSASSSLPAGFGSRRPRLRSIVDTSFVGCHSGIGAARAAPGARAAAVRRRRPVARGKFRCILCELIFIQILSPSIARARKLQLYYRFWGVRVFLHNQQGEVTTSRTRYSTS
jgi:hypothetical protein